MSTNSPAAGAEIAREALRRETAATHTRVETTLGLGAPDVTWAMYHAAVAALLRGYGAVAGWLPEAMPRLTAGTCARLGSHLERLRADVAYARGQIGEPARSGSVAPAPLAAPPQGWGAAHGFGMLYVVEGSTLGGQHVARAVAAPLGADPAHGLAFFYGDGPKTGQLWRAFRADLARHVTTLVQVEEAVAGANWAFATVLAAWESASR